jgi:hypothetical protein
VKNRVIDKSKLPEARSEEYFKFMTEFIEKADKQFGIQIYGFTDYISIAFYFVKKDGTLDNHPNSVSFSTLYERMS